LFIYLNWQIKLNVEPFYALDDHLQLSMVLFLGWGEALWDSWSPSAHR